MVKNLNTFLSGIFLVFLLFFSLILALSKQFSSLVSDGINLWFAVVVPSLFPYFFITTILSSLKATSKLSNAISPLTRKLFNVNGAVGYAFFMSVLCGYPVGAKLVCDLKEKGVISQSESVRASVLCSTSSPMFLINSVGGLMFNDTSFGIILFACHLLCAIILGFIFSFYKRKEKPSNTTFSHTINVDNILYESAYSAVISILVVGAIITIFYTLSHVLFALNILSPITSVISFIIQDEGVAKGLTLGAFECTQGLKQLSICGLKLKALPYCSFICGFGGVSVLMQSLAYLKKAKIKTAPFVLSKCFSAVLNFIVCYIICLLV